jgi:hypothetical protein
MADSLSGKNGAVFETEYKNVLGGGEAEVNVDDFVESACYYELVKFARERLADEARPLQYFLFNLDFTLENLVFNQNGSNCLLN